MNHRIIQSINERILSALDQRIVPWQQPWRQGVPNQNLASGHIYQDVNEWLTFCNTLGLTAYRDGITDRY